MGKISVTAEDAGELAERACIHFGLAPNSSVHVVPYSTPPEQDMRAYLAMFEPSSRPIMVAAFHRTLERLVAANPANAEGAVRFRDLFNQAQRSDTGGSSDTLSE